MVKKILSLLLCCLLALQITSPASANNETYLPSGSTYSSTLTSSNDKHWYQFTTLEDNGDVNIYLSNYTAPVGFYLFDSNKNRLSYSNTSYFESLKAGTYYIEVHAINWGDKYSSTSYEIIATYAGGNVKHDPVTFEPNDTRENAYYLNSGSKISSSISSINDRDFYKITTTKDNGDVNIYLSNYTAPVGFYLFDSKKNRLSYSNTSYFESLKAGTYYIQVHPSNWGDKYTSGNYDLIATYSTSNVKHDPVTLEPNDTRESAYPIKSGQTIASSLTSILDNDFYTANLNRTGTLSVNLFENTATSYFVVYDSNKQQLSYSDTSFSRELKAGTYYIKVYGYSWGDQYSSGTYKLKASYPSADAVSTGEIKLTLNSKAASIKKDGKVKNVTLLQAPYLKGDTTLVPLRFVSEQLGATVLWNAQNKTIKVSLDGTIIDLTVDSRYVGVNGRNSTIQVAPEIKGGVTFVPLRFVSEQLGKDVNWNPANKTIIIK